jgi:DNA/RNA endonuclease YhcR with UshA esterase domain
VPKAVTSKSKKAKTSTPKKRKRRIPISDSEDEEVDLRNSQTMSSKKPKSLKKKAVYKSILSSDDDSDVVQVKELEGTPGSSLLSSSSSSLATSRTTTAAAKKFPSKSPSSEAVDLSNDLEMPASPSKKAVSLNKFGFNGSCLVYFDSPKKQKKASNTKQEGKTDNVIYVVTTPFIGTTSGPLAPVKFYCIYKHTYMEVMYWIMEKNSPLTPTCKKVLSIEPFTYVSLNTTGFYVKTSESLDGLSCLKFKENLILGEVAAVSPDEKLENYKALVQKRSSIISLTDAGLNQMVVLTGRILNVSYGVKGTDKNLFDGNFTLYDDTAKVTINFKGLDKENLLYMTVGQPLLMEKGRTPVIVSGSVIRYQGNVKVYMHSLGLLRNRTPYIYDKLIANPSMLVDYAFDHSGLDNLAFPQRSVEDALMSPLRDSNEYFSDCTIVIDAFVGSPMYLGCRRCQALGETLFKLDDDMSCTQCGVLDDKKLVVCCLKAAVDCVIDGNEVSNVLVCKDQDDALFTKSVSRCMNDGVSAEETPIGKTFRGVFMLTSSRRLLMKLERMEVNSEGESDEGDAE